MAGRRAGGEAVSDIQRRAIASSSRHNGEIVGAAICKALGLDPKITGRIVIDIPVRGLIQVYAELYGTAEVIDVITTIDGPDIRIAEGTPEGVQGVA